VWRDVGATYHAAGMYEDAREALERFLSRRPANAEGLYMLGLTLAAVGREQEAREQMRAVVEAVRTAPTYKHRLELVWMHKAEAYLNEEGDRG
jgi:hypothetical protein